MYEDDFGDEFVFGDEDFTERVEEPMIRLPPKAENGLNSNQTGHKFRGGFGKPPSQSNGHLSTAQRGRMHHSGKNSKRCMPAPKDGKVLPFDDFRMAIMKGNTDVVTEYIDQGVPVDTVLRCGWTGLMYGASNANVSIVQLLLAKGANPNFHKDQYTPLMAACKCTKNNEEDILTCVKLLISYNADVNAFDRQSYAISDFVTVSECCHCTPAAIETARYHVTPLIYAAREGRAEVVKALMDAGVNLNKQDTQGSTALIWSACKGHKAVVHLLVEQGADPKKTRQDGSTAADIADTEGHIEIAEFLGDKYGKTRLSDALLRESQSPSTSFSSGAHNSTQSSVRKPQKTHSADALETVAYGDLELFLSGLELGHLASIFRDHQINFTAFLRMDDHDLQQIGIQQFGTRKKILDGIQSTHKKEWENSSIPQVQYNRHITLPEAVAMVQNITKHTMYISASIGYVADQIARYPAILEVDQDGAKVNTLCLNTEESVQAVSLLFGELTQLRAHLSKVTGGEPYKPPDLIDRHSRRRRKTNKLPLKIALGATIIGGILLWKGQSVADFVNKWMPYTVS